LKILDFEGITAFDPAALIWSSGVTPFFTALEVTLQAKTEIVL
jgi:hypothetical protein